MMVAPAEYVKRAFDPTRSLRTQTYFRLSFLFAFLFIFRQRETIAGNTSAFAWKYRNLAVVVHVLLNTQILVISRRCFAGNGQEMYQDSKRMAEFFFLLLVKPFVW